MGSRYIKLTETEIKSLRERWETNESSRIRNRAHALLLSNTGLDIETFCNIFFINRNTIGRWFNSLEEKGLSGLSDAAKSGRGSIFTNAEKRIIEEVKSNPVQQVKVFTEKIKDKFKKSCSCQTIKRIFKASNFTWKNLEKNAKLFKITKR